MSIFHSKNSIRIKREAGDISLFRIPLLRFIRRNPGWIICNGAQNIPKSTSFLSSGLCFTLNFINAKENALMPNSNGFSWPHTGLIPLQIFV